MHITVANQLDDALARIQSAESEIKTEDHRERLASFHRDVAGLKLLLDKLRATIEAGTLQDSTIREQATSEEGRIVEQAEEALFGPEARGREGGDRLAHREAFGNRDLVQRIGLR